MNMKPNYNRRPSYDKRPNMAPIHQSSVAVSPLRPPPPSSPATRRSHRRSSLRRRLPPSSPRILYELGFAATSLHQLHQRRTCSGCKKRSPASRFRVSVTTGLAQPPEIMGTREVYEEKLRSGAHLHRDPTINPGLGSARCPRCLSLLNPTTNSGEGDWAVTSVLHDATSVTGAGAGAMLSAVHGFNTGIPFVQKHVKGPKWLHLLVGVPPLILFSGASSLFGAYALPSFAQLIVTSYYAASSASHYAISQITRQIEKFHLSGTNEKSS